MKGYGGRAGIAPDILNLSIRGKVSGQLHAHAALSSGKNPQSRSERDS
jgi:hypothetical protein